MISKINRARIANLLRKIKLLRVAEYIRFKAVAWSLKRANAQFVIKNPGFKLPPAELAYDAYSAPDWNFYKSSGEGTAEFLANMIKKHRRSDQPISVYEWGCGPGRVIRYLPEKVEKGVIFGSDYNSVTIDWCSKSIEKVSFSLNNLNPPLVYEKDKFDFIYCISVFTHLSENTGLNWINELHRVLKPNGLILLTTASDYTFEKELLNSERKVYEQQGIVIKGEYEEGKKMFLARHSPSYVRERLLKQFDVKEHSPAGFPYISQDYWLAQKRD